jgi:2-oxoisovalerate dehydrogenase E2 component (dihydrolipoyl transacylase)
MKTFNLPDLGEGLVEAEIVRWHVNSGDYINADDPMLAVETAKAIVEVPSPFSGVIKATHGKPGDTVATGALLVEFQADADSEPVVHATDAGTVVGSMPVSNEDYVEILASDTAANVEAVDAVQPDSTPTSDRVRAVPAARALAKRLGIDIGRIHGTGRGGLVTVDDVLHMTTAGRPQATDAAAPATRKQATNSNVREWTAAEKLRGPRRAMAQSMAISRDNVAGCTLFDDADLHDWEPEQDITSRILRAIAQGCAAEPALNAWYDGATLTRHIASQIDVAIAVDTPEGLIVPVVRNIGDKPVAELRRAVDELKRNTHERTIRAADLRDFTFMLSNFGMIAGRYATPVVVPPAVAILGCGRLGQEVIATRSGTLEAHRRMPLSLTFDHRCVTGGEAARFLAAVIRDLQKGN